MTLREGTEDEVMLNKAAQGLLALAEVQAWFEAKPAVERVQLLRELLVMTAQAHPTAAEIDQGIAVSGVKAGYTAAVLLRKNGLSGRGPSLAKLPDHEHGRVLRLLLAVLGVADGRRRATRCVGGCSHWWHRDLTNPAVVERILGRT